MTEHVSFAVEGEPRAKQSFRYSRKGHYTNPDVTAWQNAVAWQARIAMQGRGPIRGRVSVRLSFYLSNNRVIDADNLSKAVLDSIKNIVIGDDHYVVHLEVIKRINKIPGVLVEVCKGCNLPGTVEGK